MSDDTGSNGRLSVEVHRPERQTDSGVILQTHVDEDAKTKEFGYQAKDGRSDGYGDVRCGWIWK